MNERPSKAEIMRRMGLAGEAHNFDCLLKMYIPQHKQTINASPCAKLMIFNTTVYPKATKE